MIDLDAVDFEKGGGLVTIVCQDHLSGAVLMVAHGNREALARTIDSGEMHYWSRTRGLWWKGGTSGNRQRVVQLRYDCDADAILAQVEPLGPACHTGAPSCFGAIGDAAGVLSRLDALIAARAAAGEQADGRESVEAATGQRSYTRRLLHDRNLRLKKIGEEAAELVTACADDDPLRACEEVADVIYHALVALRATGGSLRDVERVLSERRAAAPE